MRNVHNALQARGQGLDVFFETCRDYCHYISLFLYKSFFIGPQDMRTNPMCTEHVHRIQYPESTKCLKNKGITSPSFWRRAIKEHIMNSEANSKIEKL